jgi:hypothetical protein
MLLQRLRPERDRQQSRYDQYKHTGNKDTTAVTSDHQSEITFDVYDLAANHECSMFQLSGLRLFQKPAEKVDFA